MMGLERSAMIFAMDAHGRIDQRRRYTGEPYIVHPAAVVALVRSVPHTPDMIAAAWLHDVVEDCGVSIVEICEHFGSVVASLVDGLTDVSTPEDGNRKARKSIDREHIAKASPEAKTIKLADLIDNTRTIVAFDPKFAQIYLAEKRLLLDVLKEGDPDLWRQAYQLAHAK